MKNREKTGKAFRIKWLLLALVADCTDLCAGCIA